MFLCHHILDLVDKEEEEKKTKPPRRQKGLYLHGEVGTGKTMLLDLLFDALPTEKKKRVHFNAFMLHLYSELNRWCLSYENHNKTDNEFLTPAEYIAENILKVRLLELY